MNPANRAAPGAAAAGGNPQQQQQGQRPSIMKMILIYMAINQAFNFFFKGNQPQSPTSHVRNVFEDNEPIVTQSHMLYLNLLRNLKCF